jgi:diguanylate cyclase (GGDEF)-like protein
MQIDSFTVLAFGFFARLVLGGLFVFFWLQQRGASWYAWWSGALFLACAATLLYTSRVLGEDVIAIAAGTGLMTAAFVCNWQAARVFDGRRVIWWSLAAAPGLWVAACLVPGFVESVPQRVVLSSAIIAPLLGLAAFEFWRGRQERLPSRWAVIVLFASFALVFALRIPLIGLLPFPFGALPMQQSWVGAFNLVMFFHTLLLTVLIVAMSKERLELEQRLKAQTDPLTGALNRRAFATRGGRLLQRLHIAKEPMCLLFLDLDRFKSFNDRFGHSGGDDVLVKFVSVVHDNIRPTDFLFRIGGEEFCCLLPRTPAAQAEMVAERIRAKFEAAPVDVTGRPVKGTVSIGIASTEVFGYDLDVLMRRADMAVYAAKQQGRNRVAVAPPDETAANAAPPMRTAATG